MNIFRFLITSGVYGVADVVGRGCQAAAMFWLAKACTQDQFGKAGILLSLQQIVAILAVGGLVESSTSLLNKYRREERVKALFYNSEKLLLAVAVIIVLLYTAASLTILRVYVPSTPFILHFAVLSSGLLLGHFNLRSNLHRLDERHRLSLSFKTFPMVLCYACGIAGIGLGKDKVEGFFVGCLVGLLIAKLTISLTQNSSPEEKNGVIDADILKSIYWGALPILPVVIMTWLSGYGANFFINAFFSKTEVGQFTLVLTLNSILLLALNSLNQVWSPRFFKIAGQHSPEHLGNVNGVVNQGMLLISSAVAGIILLYFQDGLTLVGGHMDYYRPIHPYLLITFSSFIFLTAYFRSINYYFLWRHQYEYMKIFVLTGVIGIITWVGFMRLWGHWGIYIGFLVSMIIRAGVTFLYARRKWQVGLSYAEIPIGLFILASSYGLSLVVNGMVNRGALYSLLMLLVGGLFFAMNRDTLRESVPGKSLGVMPS